MTEVQGRRAPRFSTDLPIQYRFRSNAPWRDCRIVDVSEHGAAVELDQLEPGESFRQRIDLQVSTVARDGVGIIFRGQIRRRSRRPDGVLVVGVEFTPTDVDCASLLCLLVGLRPLASDA
jgi:hypothetical protein